MHKCGSSSYIMILLTLGISIIYMNTVTKTVSACSVLDRFHCVCMSLSCTNQDPETLALADYETKVKVDSCLGVLPRHRAQPTTCTRELFTDFRSWLSKVRQDYLQIFPIDVNRENYVRTVNDAVFSVVQPIPFKTNVKIVAVADEVLSKCLDLDPTVVNSATFLDIVSGNNRSGLLPPGLAHRYGGHQFGYWAGQLGDGRALMIGEFINSVGQRWELQLKGSGTTPYSRRGDGRAVLRSSVREFLASEALHYLDIPTSRAASLVVSDDEVIRDQFYDGHPIAERGAIVLRLAPSWFRIGSLEILSRSGEINLLKSLLDHVIHMHFKDIDVKDKNKYLMLFQEIVSGTARMIAKWQSVGFTHGVCNTDNFSLLSITIDYGPFGFLDHYDPGFVPNTSDDEGRYSYENQPDVGFYNLEKLKDALEPMFDMAQSSAAKIILHGYVDEYKQNFMNIFVKKLGLSSVKQDDENLVAVLLKMMEETKADFTMTFHQLGEISLEYLNHGNFNKGYWSLKKLKNHDWFQGFVKMYTARLKVEGVSDKMRMARMRQHNPRYILRNWMAESAIAKAEKDDFSEVKKVYEILKMPFTHQADAEKLGYASEPPPWSRHIKVSCSS